MDEKIDGQSTAILTGDFNIWRYPLTQHFLGNIFGKSPGVVEYLPHVEREYDDLVDKLAMDGTMTVTNCWDRDNASGKNKDNVCITIGETIPNDKVGGKPVPMESLITAPLDLWQDNCLDYLFLLQRKGANKEHFTISDTKVEKFLLEKGTKGEFGGRAR